MRIDKDPRWLARGPESELLGGHIHLNTFDAQPLRGLDPDLKREMIECARLSKGFGVSMSLEPVVSRQVA